MTESIFRRRFAEGDWEGKVIFEALQRRAREQQRAFQNLAWMNQGGDSIDILDGLNRSLNPSRNHFSLQCLPKRILNLILNPSLNPSLKF